jgi:predicted XRE-type DNA-binding protein
MAKTAKTKIERSSGNIFADLNLANAEDLSAKLRLCVILNKIIEQRAFTQIEAARILGISQPKVSALKAYKLEGFSVERLMHLVTALEYDVVIQIRPHAKSEGVGRVTVVGAA